MKNREAVLELLNTIQNVLHNDEYYGLDWAFDEIRILLDMEW